MGESDICMMQEIDGDGRPLWVREIDSEVENDNILKTRERDAHRRHAIYRVPNFFIGAGKRNQAYSPEMVSMGPYHHGEDQLLPMEDHKRRALRHFLVRKRRGVSEYREALKGVVQELMDSYKDLPKEWKDDEERFLQLMIFDGCFMIELLRIVWSQMLGGYDEDDPIFSRHGMLSNMPRIKRDMLMIENQIPLLVLKKLLSVEQGIHDLDEQKQRSLNQTVNSMVLAFFGLEEKSILYSERDEVELGLHALDVVRKSMIKDIKGGNIGGTAASKGAIWPATQLQEAGIKFRKSGSPSLKDIDFSLGCLYATLSLPQLVVDDATESKFLNIMAFEHLHVSSGNEVRSYVCFLDNIIDSEKDGSLLSQNDIIKNFVGTDQAVADLFHRIAHDVSIDPSSNLSTVHKNVTGYCHTGVARTWYSCSTLFFSAWVWISSQGATLLVIVTCLLLLYAMAAMLDFYRNSPSSI